ncbi:MBL fold metallo-hydrolase [uncultured Tateyamaria sp.]|uniref:MBL fold metallo-hydrolase n=1 Tax=uncultured Tateyamaria sp. TaxID=455651 RepID=UPI00261F4501|nr:MBL fold metallo-hydrolase [uncultured Tateyamaria sp.]
MQVDVFDPVPGQVELLEPGLCRIVAPNPSPMTYRGTNTYLVGGRDLAVIDPGPDDPTHLDAILTACGPDARITHIVVTHSHLDHAPLAGRLSQATGAPTYGFGPASAGRSAVMERLAQTDLVGGGEGIDTAFVPDHIVGDGAQIIGSDWTLDIIHTPGHLGNHICLGLGDACLTADHVMGWASSLVSPPDGDLTDFMASCDHLNNWRDWRVFYPGHGAPITDPHGRLDWLITHRRAREAAILDALRKGPATATQIAQAVYTDTPPALLGAATRNVLAHLIDLAGKSQVAAQGTLHADAVFQHAVPQ